MNLTFSVRHNTRNTHTAVDTEAPHMVAAAGVLPRLVVVDIEAADPRLVAAEEVAAAPNREVADNLDMGSSVPADMDSAVVADTEVVDTEAVVEAEADIEAAEVGVAALAIADLCRNYRKISRLQLKARHTWDMEPSVA
jgi:hypothetical protein